MLNFVVTKCLSLVLTVKRMVEWLYAVEQRIRQATYTPWSSTSGSFQLKHIQCEILNPFRKCTTTDI